MNPLETWLWTPEPDRDGRAATAKRVTPIVLLLLLFGSTVSAGGLYRALDRMRDHRVSDGASILAFEGVRAFAEDTDVKSLMEIPLGADSLIMKARVFDGEGSTGTYAVRVAHVSPAAFLLKSTGRLIAGGRSMICSVDVRLRLNAVSEDRPPVGVEDEPLCNGSRHRSAVTRARTIGS
ncbi:MAG: hypothetical protein ACREL7_17890 [Longimicrobiales bacterium]